MNTEEKIMEVLEKTTIGLSISEVAKALKISRMTAARYLDRLVAEKKVYRRKIGAVKLHYKTEM